MDNSKKLLFIDAETDGLYGSFISVAMKVIDCDKGEEIEAAYYGIKKENLDIKEEWVKENVEPYLGEYIDHDSEKDLLNSVWDFWEKNKENTLMIADVAFPVEARLITKCVLLNQKERIYSAPFPLIDLSSMLYTIGIEPNRERESLLNNCVVGDKHNASYDINVSIEIWKKYFWKRQ